MNKIPTYLFPNGENALKYLAFHKPMDDHDSVLFFPNVEGIGFVTLDEADVVRHPLVRKIILAYDGHQPNKKK